ncbi:hypothetical protein M422DRAFT_253840 [Sphaerobolus stellatus SS14]|uniref:Uncharacterized protein n=1 Tax=Sphaerobolus stellatus (strain SS14) TaxID=990650 RepID=A0A0C9VWB8_SPHS4|nr:hypothetical protein M422DRAFT_253840 [Sphaerobolus stellatus SS14]
MELKRDDDDNIVQISDDEVKKVPTPKSTSKPCPAKKAKMVLSDSEDDQLYIAECIIDVELPSVAQNNGRKSKTVKQTPLSSGPIEMDKKTTHIAFLAKIAAAIESMPECLDEWSADFQQTTSRWNTTQEETTTEDAGASRRLGHAHFDDDLKATVEQLKAKHPEGCCEYHKDNLICLPGPVRSYRTQLKGKGTL